MALMIEDGKKLLMVGDSITDCGRGRPVGEAPYLGTGYVAIVDAALAAAYPERRIRVVNMGTSGDQVRHLKARWKAEVLDLEPDWLSIMIGINDVWRRFDRPHRRESHVSLGEYEETLDGLAAEARARVEGLVLMTPYFLEPSRSDPMREAMDGFGAAAKRIAAARGAILVDTQAAFDRILAHRHSMSIAWDRVHPDAVGHMALALAFLDAIGHEWPTGLGRAARGRAAPTNGK